MFQSTIQCKTCDTEVRSIMNKVDHWSVDEKHNDNYESIVEFFVLRTKGYHEAGWGEMDSLIWIATACQIL